MRMILAGAALLAASGAAASPVQQLAQACWSPPRISAPATVTVRLGNSGEIIDFGNADGDQSDPAWRPSVEALVRAIRRCSPYDVPAGDYQVSLPFERSSTEGDLNPFKELR